MKTIKAMSIAAVAALSLMSAASFAQSVTATSLTMDGAEAKPPRRPSSRARSTKSLRPATATSFT